MNPLADLPITGQWTILGVLVGIIVFILVQFFRGEIVTRKHLDQVQKIADGWRESWGTTMQVQASTITILERMVALADTFEHFLESLPKAPPETDV